MEEESIRAKAKRIKFLVLDVDGTLTDGGVYIDQNGIQSRKFSIRDGMGITLLQDAGIPVGLVSHSNMQQILDERSRMLSIRYVYSGKEPKLNIVHRWMRELNLAEQEIAYMGDDVNDLDTMAKVGLSACPADAHFLVVKAADVVLRSKGGEGCVREFIDRYLLHTSGNA